MRENGLRAAKYVAVVDLHPQVADLMLEALEEEGVAAYAAPVTSSRGLMLPTQFPTGPLDRLFVDREAYDTARKVLDEHLPSARAGLEHAPAEAVARTGGSEEPAPGEAADGTDPSRDPVDDETWSKIVAAFHGPGPQAPATEPSRDDTEGSAQPDPKLGWPAAEDVDPEAAQDTGPTRAAARPAVRGGATAHDEDRYEPPPPPPLPIADSTTRLAWAGVVGGPLLFILALLLDWDLASWAQLAGVAALVVGFVTLVARMRDDGIDDDPDNGAVV